MMSEITSGNGAAKATINGRAYEFGDVAPGARQMLDTADFRPADDCVLIRNLRHGTRVIGLDDRVDLREPDADVFWAFRTDRIFRFTIDDHEFDWGRDTISESELRAIAHVARDEVLVLEHRGRPDQDLGPSDELRFGPEGTEHLRIEKPRVTVYFKNKPFELPRGTYTTEQLIAAFPIEPGYLLLLRLPDDVLEPLKPGQKIRLKNGMHFYSQVPGGGSS